MKNIRLNVAKSLLMIAVLCPMAFADGDQGSGGFANSDEPVISVCQASAEGDQGSGGLTGTCEDPDPDYIESVLKSIYVYFESMI